LYEPKAVFRHLSCIQCPYRHGLVDIINGAADCRHATEIGTEPYADSKSTSATVRLLRTDRLPTVGLMSALRVPTSVPTGADRHMKVPTSADRGCRGQGAARRGTPRAARLCRYQICSSRILQSSQVREGMVKWPKTHQKYKLYTTFLLGVYQRAPIGAFQHPRCLHQGFSELVPFQ
jgi:hypothetical protein